MNKNWIEIIIGVAAIIYSIVSIYFRIKSPTIFKKMEPMKRVYGTKLGEVIHIILYTLIPLIVGIIFIVLFESGRIVEK